MIQIKRGDTFLLACQAAIDGVPVDLTGWAIRSQVRDKAGNLLADLVVDVTDAAAGSYSLRHDDTTGWEPARHYCDIEYTTDAGQVISTETVEVRVTADITQQEAAP